MVKVVVDHELKDKKDTEAYIKVMRELTNDARKQPGYITGETLVNTEDERNILVIATWHSSKHFADWCTPEIRQKVNGMYPLILMEPPRLRIYSNALERKGRVWST
jgi:heme-degrading monooxygenase HmoA